MPGAYAVAQSLCVCLCSAPNSLRARQRNNECASRLAGLGSALAHFATCLQNYRVFSGDTAYNSLYGNPSYRERLLRMQSGQEAETDVQTDSQSRLCPAEALNTSVGRSALALPSIGFWTQGATTGQTCSGRPGQGREASCLT